MNQRELQQDELSAGRCAAGGKQRKVIQGDCGQDAKSQPSGNLSRRDYAADGRTQRRSVQGLANMTDGFAAGLMLMQKMAASREVQQSQA